MATSSDYSSDRLKQTQQEVDEVRNVMKNNVSMILERDSKLSELDARADNLNAASSTFAMTAQKVRKKYWWENLKMKLIIGGVIITLVVIIITIIAVEADKGGNGGNDNPPTTNAPEIVDKSAE